MDFRDRNKFSVTFTDLSINKICHATHRYDTVFTFLTTYAQQTLNRIFGSDGGRIKVLHRLDGIVESGEILLVLGKPGSGTSEFLQTLVGETSGFEIAKETVISYEGSKGVQV